MRALGTVIGWTTKKKMVAVGVSTSILVASVFFAIGVLDSFVPTHPDDIDSVTPFTINRTVHNAFADFVPYDEGFVANVPNYTLNADLSNISNPSILSEMTESQKGMLADQGFVVVPQRNHNQIYTMLKYNYWYEIPSFVTTDAVLHAFHVLYDRALQEIETYTFWDLLGNLTNSLLNDSYSQYLSCPEGPTRQAALMNVAYFSVAACLMDSTTPIHPEVQTDVNTVLSLISTHSTITNSWFMGTEEDFTQYLPRGHYTRTEQLGKYFQAMMWYGRVSFRLAGPIGAEHTRQAILLCLAMENEVAGLSGSVSGYTVWDAINEATSFIVGSSDDLQPREYAAIIEEVYGSDPEMTLLSDDQLLTTFIQKAQELRDPLILGTPDPDAVDLTLTKGMRFMGQKYVPDSYILGQLVFNHVGTPSEPRLIPKGLDIMAALGSERAWELLDDQKDYYNYVEQMQKMRLCVGNVTPEEWTRNLYYLWLYSLLPLLYEPGQGYPMFTQNQAWVDKQLNTALASWTELRHDTILYAKSSYSASCIPSWPGGYVEPVPQVYGRLASLCDMLIGGLGARGLLSEGMTGKISLLRGLLLSFRAISIKQLQGQPLNQTDINTLLHVGERFEEVNRNYTSRTPVDRSMALIADVHTDPNSGLVLEEAVGYPMYIYVVIPNGDVVSVARGGVFSYYEFTQPMESRMTDEAWQQMLADGDEPEMPDWTSSFIAFTASSALITTTVSKGIDEE